MNNERYYSVEPGEVILHSKEPIAVEYRREPSGYLSKYPRGKDKNDLKQRLRSYTESGFYSACFELFLYSLLTNRSKSVIPHPVLPNVSTHPEFEVVHNLCNFFLEATLALQFEEYQAQEQRQERPAQSHPLKKKEVIGATANRLLRLAYALARKQVLYQAPQITGVTA